MYVTSNRTQPRLQFLQPRLNAHKYTANLQLHYSTGQSNPPEYRLRISNHYNFPAAGEFPEDTGKISFSVSDSYWSGNKLQAKEVSNSNPNSGTMDATVDGAYANLNGFSVESIPPGGWRDVLIKVNGTALSFTDALLNVSMKYPS